MTHAHTTKNGILDLIGSNRRRLCAAERYLCEETRHLDRQRRRHKPSLRLDGGHAQALARLPEQSRRDRHELLQEAGDLRFDKYPSPADRPKAPSGELDPHRSRSSSDRKSNATTVRRPCSVMRRKAFLKLPAGGDLKALRDRTPRPCAFITDSARGARAPHGARCVPASRLPHPRGRALRRLAPPLSIATHAPGCGPPRTRHWLLQKGFGRCQPENIVLTQRTSSFARI
jgi:hypothetical protein